MSDIHIYRIEQHLKDVFEPLIDLSDISKLSSTEKYKAFLSRAQCALAIKYLARTSNEQAADSITDGYQDNGIDGILVDFEDKVLYLAQSKWISKGSSVPRKKDIQSYLFGVDDLIKLNFNKFNDRVIKKKDDLIKCFKDPTFKIKLVITYTSMQPIAGEALQDINDRIDLYNDSTDLFCLTTVTQKELYKALLAGIEHTPINLTEITLYNWGKHSEPYEALYGEIEAEQIAKLWAEYGQTLLTKNLRQFKDVSQVNDLIKYTLANQPDNFWYFNNGITALCKGVGKGAIHGNDRTAGVFSIQDVSIVNGAQTYGSIGEAYKQFPENVKNAKVHIRFINLNNAPEGFEKKITRYTNTQNRIENKDFASLDPEQERIKHDLLLDKKEYVFRTGEKIHDRINGCDIEEVTFALACANDDINLSIIAHRNIGSIWLDIDKPPYKTIFNIQTTGQKVWRSVVISRFIRDKLGAYNPLFEEDIKSIVAIHGDSLIHYKVFQIFGRQKLGFEDPDYKIEKEIIQRIVDEVLNTICVGIKELYPMVYINSLFKNADKVINLSRYIDFKLGLEKNLFNN